MAVIMKAYILLKKLKINGKYLNVSEFL